MSEALVNPILLRWARERASLAIEVLADKLGTKVEKIIAWESGEIFPSFNQAQKIAKVVHIPFGYLFLSRPPKESIPIPDLRTNKNYVEPSPDFKELISDIMRKWNWFSDYLKEENINLSFINKYNINSSPEEVASDISSTLLINDGLRNSSKSWEEFLRSLIFRAEDCGIWIMRSGIVGNNTHRPLSVDEFRGFVICHSYAPLIFINGKDAKAAQIFTVAHELAHLWIGASGISNISLNLRKNDINNDIEKFCDAVAAELLVPKRKFLSYWDSNKEVKENADNLTKYFRVSSIVIARRALDLNLINWPTFWDFYENDRPNWNSNVKDSSEGGGDHYLNIKWRNGLKFSRAVLSSAFEGKLLFRDASNLLGVKVDKLERYAKEIKLK